MKADLHVHTDISDSSFNLDETIKISKNNGVTHLGITNHDTIEGLKEAIKQGEKEGIKVIPGIEISAWNPKSKKKVHILGYNFDLDGENIKNLCSITLKRRHENSMHQVNILINNNYNISLDKILMRAKNSKVIYKQHIMAELIEMGYADDINADLYKKLFKNDGICAMDIEYVDALDAVKAIKADNGIAVLAHPGQLNSYDIIDELVGAGLDGLELNHEDHDEEDLKRVKEYSDKYNLLLTGGSDFHGKYGTGVNIGDINCPSEYIHIFDKGINKYKFDDQKQCFIKNQYLNSNDKNNFDVYEAFSFAKNLVKAVGRRLKEVIKDDLNLKFKNNNHYDIVTKCDIETESILVENISEKYPHHTFITEEKCCDNQCISEYTWIIDPIDGTTNFVSIGKEFAVSVALYHNESPLIGIVYDAAKDKLYSAILGKGAFLNDIPLCFKSSSLTLKDSLIDMSLRTLNILCDDYGINLYSIIKSLRGHRAFGSAALSICKIASGELQGYVSAKLNIWDYAAAIIILKEAGDCYIYADNEKDELSLKPVTFIAAENAVIMQEIKELIQI
ncbi:MAG: inositol monophosphatase family protein [Bacillota bacterium]|nr:inositol monophosphatase family protein [Bacillota bacterium]